MKVVFLDIDGVLNTERNLLKQIRENNGENKHEFQFNFDPESMASLQEIIEKSDARIVISSTWRGCMDAPYDSPLAKYRKAIIHNLAKYGRMDLRLLGTTPGLSAPRGKEIKKWLDDHELLDIEAFVILDDDDDMQELTPNLVQAKFKDGLCKEHVEPALSLLGVVIPYAS